MTNSMYDRRGFATVSDYPRGLMNLCVCGQVVLAPATEHDSCAWCDTHNTYRKACDVKHTA